jgi:hypothetical protein
MRDFRLGGALHPLRRPRGAGLIGGHRALVLIALAATRRYLLIGPAHAGERIGLTDQPRQFSQRIALSPSRRMLVTATIVIVARWKRSILISISHRDDACPSGKPPTHFLKTNWPLPDALTGPHVNGVRHVLSHFGRSVDAENGEP